MEQCAHCVDRGGTTAGTRAACRCEPYPKPYTKPYPKPCTLARVEVISPCRGRFDLPGERFFSREYFKRCRLFWRQSTTRDGRVGTERTGIARPVGTNEVEERASLDTSD